MFTQISQTAMEEMVYQTAMKLLEPQNRITNLEIKKQLFKDFAAIKWVQQFVSDTMNFFYEQGLFIIVDDNGTYRTYASPNINPVTIDAEIITDTQVSISSYTKTIALDVTFDKTNNTISSVKTVIDKNKAKDLMEKNRGHYFTVFVNENGQKIVLNCQYVKSLQDQNNPNSVNLQLRKNTSTPIVKVDLDTIVELNINRQLYEVV